MRWRQGRRSDNVEDRRRVGLRGRRAAPVGGLGLLVLLGAALLFGADPIDLLQQLGGAPVATTPVPGAASGAPGPEHDELTVFVSVVLADTEDTWARLFAEAGDRYEPPTLVLFSEAVRSACGVGSAAVGPFYCPVDRKVYIDLVFFRELDRRFGAPGDFAQAYVLAHEVGHHVQNLLGIASRVREQQARLDERERNALSVRLELQADCLAGIWAYHAHAHRQILEPGDAEEGLKAAAAIGDDVLQRRGQGHVVPESWTHGSSEQRARWLRRGLATGRLAQCNTFETPAL